MDKSKENFRPPIVTIMGHVDHGKTTLLDAIRKTNVAQKEHGGITQHIGAYQIIFQDKPITFVDTPGHAAFERMRYRGAQIADIVVLVVAATEGVKPQTQEAIKHIKKENRQVVVAITKTDLQGSNPEKIKKELQKEEIIAESYGGNVPVVEIATPKGKGITELLEVIELLWQISPQKSLPKDPLEAVVVESYLDKNRGSIATVIVEKGTLTVGQKLVVDTETITVKALIDDLGKSVKEAIPGKPVEILGFKHVLEVGALVKDQITTKSQSKNVQATLSEIIAKSEEARGRFKVIVKADVTGSLEAVIENIKDKVLVINSGTGAVTPADISFAKVSKAPILAFNSKVSNQVKSQADREGVVIKNYSVIYDLIKDMEDVATGFEEAKQELKITGRAKIVATFDIEGKKIAGAQVTQGKLKITDKIILKRQNTQIGESEIKNLKRFKKEQDTVSQGQDCGILLEPILDFTEGDVIESLGSK